ncbi:MAG: hypothetical protein IJX01_02855, partial [Oscillospiraceae bacterium]|nr:hypothetical protein [Oscillospiraceae bacterium]
QNAKCKIEVFPSEMVEISRQGRHLHSAFSILHFALSALPTARQTEICPLQSKGASLLACPVVGSL